MLCLSYQNETIMVFSTMMLFIFFFTEIIPTVRAVPRASESRPPRNISQDQMSNYLMEFGYLPKSNIETGELRSEDQFKEAIRELQKYGNVPVTGEIDEETSKLIRKPRCGVPDSSKATDFTSNIRNHRHKRFVLQGEKWEKMELTWSLVNQTMATIDAGQVRRIIHDALNVWANNSRLSFREILSEKADIQVLFAKREHGDGYDFDGPGNVLAHAFYPDGGSRGGDAHFDVEERWNLDSRKHSSESTNLLGVAVHEFGHSLGLGHSSVEGAIMFPWYNGYKINGELPDDDRLAIQQLYGAKTKRWGPLRPQQPRTTTTTTTTTMQPHVYYPERRKETHYAGNDPRNDPRYNPRSDRNDPRYDPRSDRNDPRYDPRLDRNDPHYDPRLDRKDPRNDPRLNRNDPRNDPRLDRNDSRNDPRSDRYDPRNDPRYDTRFDRNDPRYYPHHQPENDPRYNRNDPRYNPQTPQRPREPPHEDPRIRPQTPPTDPRTMPTRRTPATRRSYYTHPTSSTTGHHPRHKDHPHHKATDRPKRRKPDTCNTNYDAISIIRGELFIFKDQYLWRIGTQGIYAGYPYEIRRLWRELPENLTRVDAVYENRDNKIVFFIGHQYYIFNTNNLEPGYPKPLTNLGLPSSLRKIDAAFIWGHNKKTYFFSGMLYWRYDEDVGHVELDYPRDMSIWQGIGYHIDTAFQYLDGLTYFFKGKGYWQFNDNRMHVAHNSPKSSAHKWMNCSRMNDESPHQKEPLRSDPNFSTASLQTTLAIKWYHLLALVLLSRLFYH